MSAYKTMTAYGAAEAIQSRFDFNDDDEVVGCRDRYMSDILGSDWASGYNFDNYTPLDVFYRAVRQAATRKYGALPF
jgi:hypothetical protein